MQPDATHVFDPIKVKTRAPLLTLLDVLEKDGGSKTNPTVELLYWFDDPAPKLVQEVYPETEKPPEPICT